MIYTEKDFELIYRATFTIVSKYVFRKTARFDDAQDIVQNVYYAFYRHLCFSQRKVENPQAYLMQMANHELARYYKEKSINSQNLDDSAVLDAVPDNFELEDDLFNQISLERIWQEINKMKEPERSLLIARYRFDMNYREIAETYHLPESTVKSKIYQAIKRLKDIFSE